MLDGAFYSTFFQIIGVMMRGFRFRFNRLFYFDYMGTALLRLLVFVESFLPSVLSKGF